MADVDFLRRRIHLHRNAVRVIGATHTSARLKSNKNRVVAVPAVRLGRAGTDRRGQGSRCAAVAIADRFLPRTARGARVVAVGCGGPLPVSDPMFPRITAHALRHTAASLAISSGANPKVVQRMLGHRRAAMTLDVYADLFDSDLDAVAESVSKMCPRWA